MDRKALIDRTASLLRDFSYSIYRKSDMYNYLNEGIERCKQIIPDLRGMKYLQFDSDNVTHLPEEYHHLLAVYSASRCYLQEERHYQATTLMNEYEIKMQELKEGLANGDKEIVDENGNVVDSSKGKEEYVKNNYYRGHDGYVHP